MITRRREFLVAGAVLGLSGVARGTEKPPVGEDVSALEDLMREHGVLRRILLVRVGRHINAGENQEHEEHKHLLVRLCKKFMK